MIRYRNETTYLLGGQHLGDTGKAIRFKVETINDVPFDAEEMGVAAIQWFPLSQITSITKNPDGADTIRVKEWILRQKEMI